MTYKTGAAARSRFDPTSSDAENVDRILLAACAVIWLAVLGSAVAAAVALVDLGSKHQESSTESGTPWLLYGVIGVSALIIVGAIPLLIRARRSAIDDPRGGGGGARPAPARTQTAGRAPEPRTQNIRTVAQASASGGRKRAAHPQSSGVSTFDAGLPPAVDRVWLRCAVVTASVMGVALLAIGIATYLMAAGHDTFSWVCYVIAGIVTLALPVIPLFYLRQLRDVADTH